MTRRVFLKDAAMIGVSLLLAGLIVESGLIVNVLERTRGLEMAGSFVAGTLFTSAFTVAPAATTLGELSLVNGIGWTVVLGAAGAVLGDLVLFRVTRGSGKKDAEDAASTQAAIQRWLARPYARWASWIVGIAILASPLPDELGIALLGVSRLKMRWFVPLAFMANALGIVLVCLAVRAVE